MFNKNLKIAVFSFACMAIGGACGMSGKPVGWKSVEEYRPQRLAYWPCTAKDLALNIPFVNAYSGVVIMKPYSAVGTLCSKACAKENSSGECTEGERMRYLDQKNPADWDFILKNDFVTVPQDEFFK